MVEAFIKELQLEGNTSYRCGVTNVVKQANDGAFEKGTKHSET